MYLVQVGSGIFLYISRLALGHLNSIQVGSTLLNNEYPLLYGNIKKEADTENSIYYDFMRFGDFSTLPNPLKHSIRAYLDFIQKTQICPNSIDSHVARKVCNSTKVCQGIFLVGKKTPPNLPKGPPADNFKSSHKFSP